MIYNTSTGAVEQVWQIRHMLDQSFVSLKKNFFLTEIIKIVNPQSSFWFVLTHDDIIACVLMSASIFSTEHSQPLCQQFCPLSSFKFQNVLLEQREKHGHFDQNGVENTRGFITISVKMLHFAFYV